MFNFHHIYNIVHIAVKLKIAARQLETVLCCFTVTRMTIQLMIIFLLMEWMCRSSEFSCLSLVGRVQIYHLRLSKNFIFVGHTCEKMSFELPHMMTVQLNFVLPVFSVMKCLFIIPVLHQYFTMSKLLNHCVTFLPWLS